MEATAATPLRPPQRRNRRPSLSTLQRQVAECSAILDRLSREALATLLDRSAETSEQDGYPTTSPGPGESQPAQTRPCGDCDASGTGTDGRWCPSCYGEGEIYIGRPSSSGGLRTDPEDPLPRKHEAGYREDSSTEVAALGRLEDVCDACHGSGGRPGGPAAGLLRCSRCQGSGRRFADPVGEAARGIFATLESVLGELRTLDKRRQVALHNADSERGRVSSLQGDCRVCGDFVTGSGRDRLTRGMDPKCYTSWTSWKLGNDLAHFQSDPARQFDAFVTWRRDHLSASAAEGSREWRLGEIDRLRARRELPSR